MQKAPMLTPKGKIKIYYNLKYYLLFFFFIASAKPDFNNNNSDSDTGNLILEDEDGSQSTGSRKRPLMKRSPSSLENFSALSESLNPSKRTSVMESKIELISKIVGLERAVVSYIFFYSFYFFLS